MELTTNLPPEAERLIFAVLEDRQKMIAALKVQRWDVTKWVVTANIALAAATAALISALWVPVLLAFCVSGFGTWLLWHYNERITRVRDTVRRTSDYLCTNFFDYRTALALQTETKSREYDKHELLVFYAAAILSALPVLTAAIAKSN